MRAGVKSTARLAPYTAWSIIFIVVPIVVVVFYAFTTAQGSFTFENIKNIFAYKEAFLISIGYALAATAVCLLIA